MIKIIPNGEGKAKLIRNKRSGLKLKVHIDLAHEGSYCNNCFIGSLNIDFPAYCLELCRDFEQVTGTRRFWFERDS